MFGEPIEIAARDPVSGHAIDARSLPTGPRSGRRGRAVVPAGALDRRSESCSTPPVTTPDGRLVGLLTRCDAE
jgi:hypothetical protein